MTGATKTQLNYWIRSGAVVPEVDVHGSGRRRVYTSRNAVEVGICVELNKFRLSPVVMKAALDGLRERRLLIMPGRKEPVYCGNAQTDILESNGRLLSYWEYLDENPDSYFYLSIHVEKEIFSIGIISNESDYKVEDFIFGTSVLYVALFKVEGQLGLR